MQQAATPPTPADTGRSAQVVNLQQMVNQLQAERVALPGVATESGAQGHDTLGWRCTPRSSIPLVPDDDQAI